MTYHVYDTGERRLISGPEYNMVFRRWRDVAGQRLPDGELVRWGATLNDDPDFCPVGPEIADIEISSGGCPGILNASGKLAGCSYCYKNNKPGAEVKNMSLATYQQVLDRVASQGSLTQVALGITGVETNPDLIPIMRYTREKGCWPNFTLTGADLTIEKAADLAEVCGALAVSCSPTNPDLCFDTVELFTSLGVEQTNIHVVVSEETMPFVRDVVRARRTDPRLARMGAVVCLMVKPKGRAKGKMRPPSQEQYEELVHEALKAELPIGFDSCSANRFLRAVDTADWLEEDSKKSLRMNSDPCESMCFSIYVNVDGIVYPCSFCEGEDGFDPIHLLMTEDFIKEVWMSPTATEFRERLLARKRSCPAFPEIDACLEQQDV